jgi:RNA-directed DNA polymerase
MLQSKDINNVGASTTKEIVAMINEVDARWVNFFWVGNSSRAFSDFRDHLEMKVLTLLYQKKAEAEAQRMLAQME